MQERQLLNLGPALEIGTAMACGLLIGIERGFSLRSVPDDARVAGIRTFTLLGLVAGAAGAIGRLGHAASAAALIGGAAAILVVGYWRRTLASDVTDATTPIAGVATLALGLLAGLGSPALAFAGATILTLVLALREEAHGIVRRLDGADVKALARFAVIAGGVLPFLPDGQFGPYGAWNPQKLWLVVVLVTGFSFAGYVVNRIVGARYGTLVTAVIGGLYSSTAITQSLAQRLGSDEAGGAEAAGIALATAVMYLRVLVLVALLATRLLAPFALLVAPALVIAVASGLVLARRSKASSAPAPPGNPIALVPALGFLLFVAVAAVAGAWAQGRFGEQGIAVMLLIIGSMDVDVAIVTAGQLPASSIAAEVAATALAGTILANMTIKLVVTITYARARARPAAFALLASMAALLGTILIALWGPGMLAT